MAVFTGGLALGLSTFISLVLTWWKLPKRLRLLSVKYKFWTDIAGIALVFMLITAITKSATGVVASIICGLLVSLGLEVAAKYLAAEIASMDIQVQGVPIAPTT